MLNVNNPMFFHDEMEISIISVGKTIPGWLYRWPWQDGDIRLVKRIMRFFGLNPKHPPITLTISQVDPETNTIWFSAPLDQRITAGDLMVVKDACRN